MPRMLPILFCACFGTFAGLSAFAFFYGKGASYLSDNPDACANCHVMRDFRDSWEKSPHHHVAVCNDCHAPSQVVAKYGSKAINGFAHSAAFTMNSYPDNIRIRPMNKDTVEEACRGCHGQMAGDILGLQGASQPSRHGSGLQCTRCHQHVGHDGRGYAIGVGVKHEEL